MSGMTSERLAGIKADLSGPIIYPGIVVRNTLDLLAEVERLRGGIEALADRLEPLARIWQEQGEIELSVPMAEQVRALRALLNPPTEGEANA